MQPYVIQQGDYLAKLAFQFAFDPQVVWNDDKNTDLRNMRTDPNMLWPTDVLYIPDQPSTGLQATPIAPGTSNSFVSDAPTVTVMIKFLDADYISKACTVDELPQLAALSTDSGGLLTFEVPVTLGVATLHFQDPPTTCYCHVGGMDPANTVSGVFRRLQNLSYFTDDETLDASGDVDTVRGALRAFKAPESHPQPPADYGQGEVGGTDSGTANGPVDIPDGAPESTESRDQVASDSPDVPSSDNASDDSDVPPVAALDNAGLRDDGSMEADVSQLLLSAHGC